MARQMRGGTWPAATNQIRPPTAPGTPCLRALGKAGVRLLPRRGFRTAAAGSEVLFVPRQ